MAVQTPPTTALYCYGVVSAHDAPPPRRGVGDERVEQVVHGRLAALTSRAPASVRARRRDLLAHMNVVAAAFEAGPVLPLRFGTVFESEEALVRDFLVPRERELGKLLREVDGQVELRVTAHYRDDALLAEIVRENSRVATLRDATRGGAGHPALVELGELVAAEVQARTARDSRALLERLRASSVRYDVGEEQIEYQLLRASFLVDRKRVAAFESELERFSAEQAGRVDVKLVGPLPPHSFVELAR
jgi:gas vesicle protein GvpL/GvpF